MHNLYILTPNIVVTKLLMLDLRTKGIPKSQIHIMGERSDILEKEGLLEANLIQTSDLFPSIKRGALIGTSLMVLLCTIYYFFATSHAFPVQPLVLIALAFVGVMLGAWGSSLIGINLKNPFVDRFKGYVKHGSYIMIVDSHNDNEKQTIINAAMLHPSLKWATDHDLEEKFGPPRGN